MSSTLTREIHARGEGTSYKGKKRKLLKEDEDADGSYDPSSSHTAPEHLKVSPTKRARTKSKSSKCDDDDQEKRLAKFKPKCPKNIFDRVQRVMSQRFFMLDRIRVGDELREEFKILGSTGNVYTVVIDRLPSCDCPDATKGNHCKHILFVYLKVLGVSLTSSHYYQKALLSEELVSVFANAPAAPNAAASAEIQAAYSSATGSPLKGGTTEQNKTRRIPKEDDDCPVCYETMGGATVDVKNLTFCETCGNALHTDCFKQWARASSILKCVWCRATWPSPGASTPNAMPFNEGYVNLSGIGGVSPVRDTSSYYHGPRSGGGWSHRY